jgi:hypothetical protein
LLQILEEADDLWRQLAEAGDLEGLESIPATAGRKAAKVHVIDGARPALVLKMVGSVPSGQKFRAMVGLGDNVGTHPLIIDDDGGSPVSLISPQLAKQLVFQGRAMPLLGKALYKDFSGVQSASGHDLGYEGDYELELHPFDESGQPLQPALKVLVHPVSAYEGDGVLIGTQQHHLWELETSYKTGLKSITGEDGRVHSIPFSVREDGAPLIPSAVRVVTPGVPEAIPWAGKPLEAAVVEKPMAETVDEHESLDQPLEEAQTKKSRTPLECVAGAPFALASGMAGAFDAKWLEETPSVPLAEASGALDRMLNQMKEMEKAAERSTSGPTYELGTRVDSEASGPLPNVKKKTRPVGYAKLMQLRLLSTTTRPRPRVARLSRGCKALVLLASTIWMAAIAAATMDGMVPDPVNWDHMPRPEPTQGSGVPSAHPDTLPWQGYNWYDPNHTATASPDPNRDPGADPPEVGDRSSKFFPPPPHPQPPPTHPPNRAQSYALGTQGVGGPAGGHRPFGGRPPRPHSLGCGRAAGTPLRERFAHGEGSGRT